MSVYQIKEIKQKDNYSFSILWTDGKAVDYRLSDLQKLCPCANCVDESTGERKNNPDLVDEQVRAVKVQSVGRYAVRITFTSGCSLGIYSFEDLRRYFT